MLPVTLSYRRAVAAADDEITCPRHALAPLSSRRKLLRNVGNFTARMFLATCAGGQAELQRITRRDRIPTARGRDLMHGTEKVRPCKKCTAFIGTAAATLRVITGQT